MHDEGDTLEAWAASGPAAKNKRTMKRSQTFRLAETSQSGGAGDDDRGSFLSKGRKVSVKYKYSWFDATITKINKGQSVEVLYEDQSRATIDWDVVPARIRRLNGGGDGGGDTNGGSSPREVTIGGKKMVVAQSAADKWKRKAKQKRRREAAHLPGGVRADHRGVRPRGHRRGSDRRGK